jgi:hypothetical protein
MPDVSRTRRIRPCDRNQHIHMFNHTVQRSDPEEYPEAVPPRSTAVFIPEAGLLTEALFEQSLGPTVP